MFQFPGSYREFRVRRSLGSSPGHFAAFHARILMTPRHPPRALRSLTTPTRPPLAPCEEATTETAAIKDPPTVCAAAASVVRRGRRPSWDNDIPWRTHRLASGRVRKIQKGPRSWRYLEFATNHAIGLSRNLTCLRDQTDRIVKKHRVLKRISRPAPDPLTRGKRLFLRKGPSPHPANPPRTPQHPKEGH